MTLAETVADMKECDKRIYARAQENHVQLYERFFDMVVQWEDMADKYEVCPFCCEDLPEHSDTCTLSSASQLLDKIIGEDK